MPPRPVGCNSSVSVCVCVCVCTAFDRRCTIQVYHAPSYTTPLTQHDLLLPPWPTLTTVIFTTTVLASRSGAQEQGPLSSYLDLASVTYLTYICGRAGHPQPS